MSKTYIEWASCKAITGQYGEFYNISFNAERLMQYANEKGYINMTMSKRREVGQYGDTHYFTLNDWKPEGGAAPQQQAPASSTPTNSQGGDDISVEDLPF